MTDRPDASEVDVGEPDVWLQRALVAFPPRWRRRHEAEFLAVRAELVDGDGSGRPPVRELFDIVRSGVAVRRQDRPGWSERFRYYSLGRTPSAQWLDWVRDDLTRSRLSETFRLYWQTSLYFLAVFGVVFVSNSDTDVRGPGPFPPNPTFFMLPALAIHAAGPIVQFLRWRRVQTKRHHHVWRGLGFDPLVHDGDPRPAHLIAPAVVPRTPPARLPLARYALPLGAWSGVAGVALIGGAAWPNDGTRFGFDVDPNSPLTASTVVNWAGAVAVVVVIGTLLLWQLGIRRAEGIARVTTHPVLENVSRKQMWFASSGLGLAGVVVGGSGLPPDLACAVIGTGLVVLAAPLLVFSVLAARWSPVVGRELSIGDFLIGERELADVLAFRR